jgi:hypothetical protein
LALKKISGTGQSPSLHFETLEIPGDQRVGGRFTALGVATGEIHTAHRSEPRVPAEGCSGVIEVRIEDVLAMLSPR